MAKEIELSIKDRVKTPYGVGEIQFVREDGVVVVLLENWKLATGASPVLYLQRDNISILPPIFNVGSNVKTSYGIGTIVEIRADSTIVVTPINWLLANKKPPLFYLNKDSISLLDATIDAGIDGKVIVKTVSTISIGSKVESPYGTGTAVEIRDADNIVVVTPDKWLLANGKPPMYYLNAHTVKLLEENEGNSFSFESRMKRAVDCKDKGTELFKEKDLEGALTAYGQALTIMNYLGDDLTNDQKAEVLEQTIPSYNNIALCCLKLERYREAAEYANNSVRLIDVLETRLHDSKVWSIMQSRGITLDQLLKKWKRRAYFLLGKGYVGMMELKLAKDSFKAALVLIQSDPTLVKEIQEIRQLLATVTKNLEKETKNAKKMWTKAFKKNDGIEGDIERASSPGTTTLSPSKSATTPPAGASSGRKNGGGIMGDILSGKKLRGPEDVDISQYGIGRASGGSRNGGGDNSAVAKKTSSVSGNGLLLGGVFALLTAGLIGGFAFMRYRR